MVENCVNNFLHNYNISIFIQYLSYIYHLHSYPKITEVMFNRFLKDFANKCISEYHKYLVIFRSLWMVNKLFSS